MKTLRRTLKNTMPFDSASALIDPASLSPVSEGKWSLAGASHAELHARTLDTDYWHVPKLKSKCHAVSLRIQRSESTLSASEPGQSADGFKAFGLLSAPPDFLFLGGMTVLRLCV